MVNKKLNIDHDSYREVQEFYDTFWSKIAQDSDINEGFAFHYGFFENGIRTYKEAMQNMNKFVGDLLCLNEKEAKKILDAGCGVGKTIRYLAKKFPKNNFTGMTISPVEVELGNKIISDNKNSNTKIILGDFLKSDIPNDSYDCIFALESINHIQKKRNFVSEMSRMLRSGGRLVVIDWFRTTNPSTYFMLKIYEIWRRAQVNITLDSCNNFKKFLVEEGFDEIKLRDLYANVRRCYYIIFLMWLPVFFPLIFKKIIKHRTIKTSDDFKERMALSALEVFIAEGKITEYLAITAVKK